MKTAVSIPDDLFDRAEGLARRTGCSRSQLYARALDAYLANAGNPADDPVTARLDELAKLVGTCIDQPWDAVGRRLIDTDAWQW